VGKNDRLCVNDVKVHTQDKLTNAMTQEPEKAYVVLWGRLIYFLIVAFIFGLIVSMEPSWLPKSGIAAFYVAAASAAIVGGFLYLVGIFAWYIRDFMGVIIIYSLIFIALAGIVALFVKLVIWML